MATAGYSGTPLPKKLGIKPGVDVVTIDAPEDFEATLGPLPDGARLLSTHDEPGEESGLAMLIAFYTDPSVLWSTFAARARTVKADGAFWIAWPKRASGVPTDITEDTLRTVGLPTGMVDNKVCAIDETWSGLRFVVRKEHRATWPAVALG